MYVAGTEPRMAARLLLVGGMTRRSIRLALILLMILPPAFPAAAESAAPGTFHHLRAAPDALAAVYATVSAVLYAAYFLAHPVENWRGLIARREAWIPAGVVALVLLALWTARMPDLLAGLW